MAASRSAAAPVRSNRASQRSPEVRQERWRGWGGRRGWPARPAVRPRWRRPGLPPAPVRSNRARSAFPRLDRYRRGWGGRRGWLVRPAVRPRWRRPGPPPPRCARTGPAARSRGWTGTWRGRGGRRGRLARPRWSSVMAASRSAAAPVRPNRVCSAVPRLDRYMARSGWSAGVACTASLQRPRWRRRGPPPPRCARTGSRSAVPRLDRYRGTVGVVGGGGLHGLLPGLDGGVEVCRLPGALEPGPQRVPEVGQDAGAVGVVGGGGLHGLLRGS